MRATEVMGKKVLDRDANALGKVEDLEVNVATWVVEGIVVRTGLIRKQQIGVAAIARMGDEVILSATRDELK